MLRLIKNLFNKRYIKFTFIGKHGLKINSKFSDQDLQDFLFMIYDNTLINDVMNSIKVNNEDQYERINTVLEEHARLAQEFVEQQEKLNNSSDDKPIIGVLSENNSMGRS